MKRTELKRKTPMKQGVWVSDLKQKTLFRSTSFVKPKPKKRVTKSEFLQARLAKIPYFTKITARRYSGIKGKAWALVSDYVRMRDFIHWKICVSCHNVPTTWRHFDAGHFISMGGHGALSGFSVENVHAQCPQCNLYASQHTGVYYAKELVRRGYDLNKIERLSNQFVKADDWFFIEVIESTYLLIMDLKKKYPHLDYPQYTEFSTDQ